MVGCCCSSSPSSSPDTELDSHQTHAEEIEALAQSSGLRLYPRPTPLVSAPPIHCPVRLNVYHLVDAETNQKLSKIGFGIYHTGVVLYGIEWSYGEGDNEEDTGLFCVTPGMAVGELFQTIDIGHTALSPEQVDTLLHRLENEWKSGDYHVLANNCNHFAGVLCKLLSTGTRLRVPSWCNRSARWGNKLIPKRLATGILRLLDEAPPPASTVAVKSNVGELPKSIIPSKWYLHPMIAKPRRYAIRRPVDIEEPLPAAGNSAPMGVPLREPHLVRPLPSTAADVAVPRERGATSVVPPPAPGSSGIDGAVTQRPRSPPLGGPPPPRPGTLSMSTSASLLPAVVPFTRHSLAAPVSEAAQQQQEPDEDPEAPREDRVSHRVLTTRDGTSPEGGEVADYVVLDGLSSRLADNETRKDDDLGGELAETSEDAGNVALVVHDAVEGGPCRGDPPSSSSLSTAAPPRGETPFSPISVQARHDPTTASNLAAADLAATQDRPHHLAMGESAAFVDNVEILLASRSRLSPLARTTTTATAPRREDEGNLVTTPIAEVDTTSSPARPPELSAFTHAAYAPTDVVDDKHTFTVAASWDERGMQSGSEDISSILQLRTVRHQLDPVVSSTGEEEASAPAAGTTTTTWEQPAAGRRGGGATGPVGSSSMGWGRHQSSLARSASSSDSSLFSSPGE